MLWWSGVSFQQFKVANRKGRDSIRENDDGSGWLLSKLQFYLHISAWLMVVIETQLLWAAAHSCQRCLWKKTSLQEDQVSGFLLTLFSSLSCDTCSVYTCWTQWTPKSIFWICSICFEGNFWTSCTCFKSKHSCVLYELHVSTFKYVYSGKWATVKNACIFWPSGSFFKGRYMNYLLD